MLCPDGSRCGSACTTSTIFVTTIIAALALAARRDLWWPGHESTAAWIVDSFWTDRIAGIARHRPHFDRLFVTDPDLVDEWSALTGRPVDALPWGSDTLAVAADDGPRPVDLLRLGRQPEAWDDDARTAREAQDHGLVFRGRPPSSPDPLQNQEAVRAALAQARLVLAFSNLVSPAPYTHPTRDYLTGRWTDALAAGCRVAGVAPRSAATLLWPEATLEVSPDSRADAWPVLAEAAAAWTPERAAEQRRRARRELDPALQEALLGAGKAAGTGWPAAVVAAAGSYLTRVLGLSSARYGVPQMNRVLPGGPRVAARTGCTAVNLLPVAVSAGGSPAAQLGEVTAQLARNQAHGLVRQEELERQAQAMDERVSFFHTSATGQAPSRSAAPAPRKVAPAKSPAKSTAKPQASAPAAKPARAATQGALALKDDPNWQEF